MGKERPPKKTETIEVRVPHETKRDFMAACRARGETASSVIRDFIDAYIAGAKRASFLDFLKELPMTALFTNPRTGLAAAASMVAVGLGAWTLMVTPSSAADKRLQAVFDRMDINRDGTLAQAEFVNPPKADADAFGIVEITVTTKELPPEPEKETRAEIFTRLDANNDGKLTLIELDRAVRVDTILKRSILDADDNGDGRVNEAELATYITAARAKAGAADPAKGVAPFTRALIAEHDGDGDGAVTPADFDS